MNLEYSLLINFLNNAQPPVVLPVGNPRHKFKFDVQYLDLLGLLYLQPQPVDGIFDEHQGMPAVVKDRTFGVMHVEDVDLSAEDRLVLFTSVHLVQIVVVLHLRSTVLHKYKAFVFLPKRVPASPVNDEQVVACVMFRLEDLQSGDVALEVMTGMKGYPIGHVGVKLDNVVIAQAE
jgi:hypothetical protein